MFYRPFKPLFRNNLKQKANYVALNWDLGAGQPFYTQSVLNSEVVGRSVAHFLNRLKVDLGVFPSSFHCIGYNIFRTEQE